MIRAVIFDLDGTLLDSERLTAGVYMQAVLGLRRNGITEDQITELYKQVVGLGSREATCTLFLGQLGLEPECRALLTRYDVREPWQVLSAIRDGLYEEMVSGSTVLKDSELTHNVDLLRTARSQGYRTGLATSSMTDYAYRMLSALELEEQMDVVLGRDQVQNPKPDPEIYLTAARMLDVPPQECLVVEDSAIGTRAGLAAGMRVIAVTSPWTRSAVEGLGVLEGLSVVHEPAGVMDVFRRVIAESARHLDGTEGG